MYCAIRKQPSLLIFPPPPQNWCLRSFPPFFFKKKSLKRKKTGLFKGNEHKKTRVQTSIKTIFWRRRRRQQQRFSHRFFCYPKRFDFVDWSVHPFFFFFLYNYFTATTNLLASMVIRGHFVSRRHIALSYHPSRITARLIVLVIYRIKRPVSCDRKSVHRPY